MSEPLIPGLPAGTSVSDRQAHGVAASEKYPMTAIADWSPPADRPRAVDLLIGQEASRIPQLVPLRHARMAVSSFTFYRGSAIVMASDLGRSTNSDLWVQLCGDAHLSNFGVFGTPERNLLFDINDFDETSPGPFEWDLMRLTASFVLAARDNGLTPKEASQVANYAATAYQATINEAASRSYLDNWYTMITTDLIEDLVEKSHTDQLAATTGNESGKKAAKKAAKQTQKDQKKFAKLVTKIRSRNAWSAVRKLTETTDDGTLRFRNEPPLLVRVADVDPALGMSAKVYRRAAASFVSTLDPDRAALVSRYTLLDVAHKVVGVGSVGLPALVGLLQGRDDHDLLPLQFKAAQASVLEEWTAPSPFTQHGQRVVVGQRLMQATGDPFLGWATIDDLHVYGRQLRDFKWSVDVNGLQADQLEGYALLCGGTLALAHARAGDPIAVAAYLNAGPPIGEAFAAFSQTYADLVERDFADFTEAIKSGEIETTDLQ